MSDVTPLDTPKTYPKHPGKHPTNDNKRFQLWQMIFALNTTTTNLADVPSLADAPPMNQA